MNWKRGLGIGLIFTGIFIISTVAVLTGAVVGLGSENYLGIFGILVLVVGIVLVLMAGDKQGRYHLKSIEDVLEEAGDSKDTVFILDSSGAINYQEDIDKIIEKYPGRTYAPKRILEELKGNRRLYGKLTSKDVKQINPHEDSVRYKRLRKMAKDFLGKTKKHKDYLVMRKMIEEEKVPAGVTDEKLDYYNKKIEDELGEKLADYNREPTKENKLWLLKREYKVSKGDIDVVATALENVALKKKTKVLANDSHIQDAIEEIAHKYKLGKFLTCIKYREYEKNFKRVS